MKHTAIVLATVALGVTACTPISTRASLAYMQTQLHGDVALAGSGGGLGNRHQNLRGDLDLDRDDPSALIQAEVVGEPLRGRIEGFRHHEGGSTVLTRPFGDFAAGSPVHSDFDMFTSRAAVSYDVVQLPLGDNGAVRLSPGASVRWYDIDLDVVGTGITGEESVSNNVFVPMPFLLGEVELGPVLAQVDGAGIAGDFGDGDGTYWDLGASLGVRIGDSFELLGGYRWLSVDVDGRAGDRRFSSDFEVRGWFIGGGARF